MTERIAPLREFVARMTLLVSATQDEQRLLSQGRTHLAQLIAHDAWLPEAFATPIPGRGAQYLLHCDPLERFSVISLVWGPGQGTPVHNHTVWGLIGVLRGIERNVEYAIRDTRPQAIGTPHKMKPGSIETVSPTVGDWHRVSNDRDEGLSISIHVYGGNIGAIKRQFLDEGGVISDFVLSYDNTVLPNLWDRSLATMA